MIILATRLGDITIEEMLIALVVFCVVVIIIMLLCYLFVKSKNDEIDSQPISEMVATIIEISQENVIGLVTVSWLLFEAEDGKRVRLSSEVRNEHMVGDKGFLRYQGTKLVSFDRGVMSKESFEERNKTEAREQGNVRTHVTQDEISQIMKEKNVPYGEAVLIAKKRKQADG